MTRRRTLEAGAAAMMPYYSIPKGITKEEVGMDAALFDVISGAFAPSGRLPFELPSSMDAVRAQKEDVPYDSRDPLYAYGAGLSYARRPSMEARAAWTAARRLSASILSSRH